MDTRERITEALQKGFVDSSIRVDESKRSQFLTNDSITKTTVLDSLKHELSNSNSFTFSVAFITESGLNELKTIFSDLKLKGIKGRIITSNYLSFNSPKIYKELMKIENLEVRISDKEGFHSKGYIFEHDEYTTLILGSSNLTSHALKINHEWNLKISSTYDGDIINSVKNTIDQMWSDSIALSEEWILRYEINYVKPSYIDFISNKIVKEVKKDVIVPNKMQVEALLGIENIRDHNEARALLVSATGTGKTYLAAFDVKKYKPKRFLFIVHREQIINDAIKSFQRVIGNDSSEYGKLTGTSKDYDKKYLFSTNFTMSNDETLKRYSKDEFDYIVIDEVHRSSADTYQKIIDHFTPKFMLGMTATPERPTGENIFEIFDYNIAYEIRLQEAMEEDLICPFHYFGVTDYVKDDYVIDKSTDLKYLVSEERVDNLVDKMEYYGYSGDRVSGLIFTSRVDEAKEVSMLLNERGYKTEYLTGEHSNSEREKVIKDLETGILDYIITVDIFNEGIDIPSINQVVMMRETQSSIVFIQQLGRGLRLHNSKEFVTIIDYIGNYKNNFMIPIALSGDNSFNEDIIRRKTIDTSYISGVSSINFEQIAKERIFRSIGESKMHYISNFKKEYTKLKNRLGRVPMLVDFYHEKSIDTELMGTRVKSYYNFIEKYDKEGFTEIIIDNLGLEGQLVLEMLSRELLDGKRLHEVILLEEIIKNGEISIEELLTIYEYKGLYVDENTIKSVLSIFDMTYYTVTTRDTYQDFAIVNSDNVVIKSTDEFRSLLNNKTFTLFLNDIIDAIHLRNEKYDNSQQFTIGEIYTRRDACRLLNWGKDIQGAIFGYITRDNSTPIFVTYKKEEVSESTDYKDEFINESKFKWYTRGKVTQNTEEVKKIIDSETNNNALHLFVKKDDATYDKRFYYIGRVRPNPEEIIDEFMANGDSVVSIGMTIDEPVNKRLYDYLTDNE